MAAVLRLARVLFSRVLFLRVLFSRVLFLRVLFSRVLLALGLLALAGSAAAEDEAGGGDLELVFEGDEAAEEEVAEPEPEPTPAPQPAPKPKPKPKPKPTPASPYIYRIVEDFNAYRTGDRPGTMRRSGPGSEAQFEAVVAADGWENSPGLTLRSVPAAADYSAWVLPVKEALGGYEGLSLQVKATGEVPEFKVGVKGGGWVWDAVPVAAQWGEARVKFVEMPGRGRFDPAKISEIVLTARHSAARPVDVTVDHIQAWKGRWGAKRSRVSLSAADPHGPGGLLLNWRTWGCVGGAISERGLVLAFWSSPEPYAPWRIATEWRELPHSLAGMDMIAAAVRAESGGIPVLLKFMLVEESGESFLAVREAPAEPGRLEIPFSQFLLDEAANTRNVPAMANGRLDLPIVTAWGVEVLPAVERSFRGMLHVPGIWAEAKKQPPPKPAPRPKPKPEPRPEPKPEPAPEPKPEPKPAPVRAAEPPPEAPEEPEEEFDPDAILLE